MKCILTLSITDYIPTITYPRAETEVERYSSLETGSHCWHWAPYTCTNTQSLLVYAFISSLFITYYAWVIFHCSGVVVMLLFLHRSLNQLNFGFFFGFYFGLTAMAGWVLVFHLHLLYLYHFYFLSLLCMRKESCAVFLVHLQ